MWRDRVRVNHSNDLLNMSKNLCDYIDNYSPIICISSNNPTSIIFMMLLFHFGTPCLANAQLNPFAAVVVFLLSITQIDIIPV